MIYPIGSKFFVLLSSWKGEFEIFMRAIPELKDMVVQAIILDRDTTTDSYLVGFKAIFEEHHKFESYFKMAYVFKRIPAGKKELTLELFVKHMPSLAFSRIREQQEIALSCRKVIIRKDIDPNSDFDEACEATRAKRLKYSIPDHVLQRSITRPIEKVRLQLLKDLELSIPLFDPLEELNNVIALAGKRLFYSQCHRRQHSHAYSEMTVSSKVFEVLFTPYLVVSGFIFSREHFLPVHSKDIVVQAFGSPAYQVNFLNPLRKPIFTNDTDLFEVHLSSQGREGDVICQPSKENKEKLQKMAKLELGDQYSERVSKVKLARMMVDERLRNTDKCVGIKQVFEIVVDQEHPFIVENVREQNGQVKLKFNFHVQLTNYAYEDGVGLQTEVVY